MSTDGIEAAITPQLERIIYESPLDDQSFRIRKLTEALVECICFSQTNDSEYFRDYFLLKELNECVRGQHDRQEFFGIISNNISDSIDRRCAKLVVLENGKVDPLRRWYLKAPSKFDARWKEKGVLFSCFRQRYKSILRHCLPNELTTIGKSYVHAYATSKDIHFSPHDTSSDFRPEDIYLGVDRVGLLCLALIVRCQLIIGVVPNGMNTLWRNMHDKNEVPAQMVDDLRTASAAVGDFVWAWGDFAEIVEVITSKYGYTSYRVRYLERPPLPHIPEDCFASFEVRVFMRKEEIVAAIERLPVETVIGVTAKERFRSMPPEEQNSMVRDSALALWCARK